MKIYLCGQKYFGQATLDLLLLLGHQVVGVSAPPETRDGDTDRLWRRAAALGIPLLRAGELRESTLPSDVDLIVCAHSHDFIGRKTRAKTRLGAIGYHPSLLPLHRGRDAIRWALKMNERVTGGSVYWLSDVVDGGAVAAQDWCFVRPGDTPESLWRRDLQSMGLRLFEDVLGDIGRGVLVRIPQDEALATWEPSFNPPSLMRPDLPQLTDGRAMDFQIAVTRDDARRAVDG
jgi:methionyl-tRNA formyltransferase